MKEFEIIREYLTFGGKNRKDVLQGTGDDCALLRVPRGQRLAVSMDTLLSGVHFMENSHGTDVAYKSVAANLSDLAAACAEPAWITLSLSLPEYDHQWLSDFSRGLEEISEFFGFQIVGGDTVKGPLSITIQAHGFVPENVFLKRSGATAGELVCVTGTLGDAALGLKVAKGELDLPPVAKEHVLKRYQKPCPRMSAGIALRGRATSGIDISDGLLADVNHISQQSGVGVLLRWERIPLSNAAKEVSDKDMLMKAALTGGDDYELCFTVPEDELDATKLALESVGVPCVPIGRMTGKPGVRVLDNDKEVELESLGFQHF